MSSRPYGPSEPLLIGYDPALDIPSDHLARFVDMVVETSVSAGSCQPERGRPSFDLRLCIKVLTFGYAMGVRSSRQLERLCNEHLAYLYLTRGDTPSYHTLCTVRTSHKELLQTVWVSLFEVGRQHGMVRLGRIVIDSSKFRADASSESVLEKDEYASMLAELERILAEADRADKREEADGGGSGTRLGRSVSSDQMRDIIRRVRAALAKKKREAAAAASAADSGEAAAVPDTSSTCDSDDSALVSLTKRMRERIEQGAAAIEEAIADERKHLCLTDPDARMMPEGIQKKIRECHSFEIAVDAGLIVAGQTTQVGSDQLRLTSIVEAAAKYEPGGILAVDADSGYFSGDAVASLISSGIDTCIPDGHTACDLHRGDQIGATRGRAFGAVPFTFDADKNQYTCSEGNNLRFQKARKKGGQMVNIYIAERECTECPLAAKCLTQANAKRRQLHVGQNNEVLEKARQRFEQPEHQERYNQRGPAVETVFGFLRATLGYTRWSLRGEEKVACEGSLFKIAYQVRKIGKVWQKSQVSAPITA